MKTEGYEAVHGNTGYEPADLLLYVRGKGLVLREKSLVAYRRDNGRIVAFGSEAEKMSGGDPENLVVMSPLRQGRVADYCVAANLFSMLLVKALGKKPLLKPWPPGGTASAQERKSGGKWLLRKPAAVVCLPRGSTEVERKALEDALIFGHCVREVLFTELSAGEVIEELEERSPDLYRKYNVMIGIGKNEPERYIEERLREILSYGAQEGIEPERVSAMMRELRREQDEAEKQPHDGQKEIRF